MTPQHEADLLDLAILASQPSGAAVARVTASTDPASALVGKTVLVGAIDPCGQCEVCRRGGAAVCPSPRPRRDGRVSSRWVVPLGDGLDVPAPAAAAIAGDVATAYTLYARTGLAPRDPVVITGATAVARFLVEIVRAKGITPVVIATDADWIAWLVSKGASAVATATEVAAAVAAQGLGTRPLRVIATDPSTLALAASLAGPRATLTVLAPANAPVPGELLAREVTIIGVAGPHPDLVTEAAAMCVKGEIDLAAGVTMDPGDRTRALVISHS